MLKDIVPVRKKIKIDSKNEFQVQGLTLEKILVVFGENQETMNKLFNGQITIPQLVAVAPVLAAVLICEAAGEPDQIENARQLAAGIQVLALEAIWDLTVAKEDELKKLISRLDGFGANLKLPVNQVSDGVKREMTNSGNGI